MGLKSHEDTFSELEKPQEFKVQQIRDKMATLEWNYVEAAASYNISIYSLPMEEQIQSFLMSSGSNLGQQSFLVSGLEPESNYYVSIFAISKYNVNSPNSSQTFETSKFLSLNKIFRE